MTTSISNINAVNNINYSTAGINKNNSQHYVSNRSLTTDKFELSNKEQTKKKIIFASELAIALGTAALFLINMRKKASNFQPAKTVDEAVLYAQKKLNVMHLYTENANIDALNSINELLYKEKATNRKIPTTCIFSKNNDLSVMSYIDFKKKDIPNCLQINMESINNFQNIVDSALKTKNLSGTIAKVNEKYELIDKRLSCENMTKFIDKLNNLNKDTKFSDKLEIYNGLMEAIHAQAMVTKGKAVKMDAFSSTGVFNHELGHMHHLDIVGDFDKLKTPEMLKQFKAERTIAKEVSEYASTDPCEFVAETYRALRAGKTLPQEVLDLYKKYNGPQI